MLPKNIKCETSTIHDGNMSFCFNKENTVIKNRELFLQKTNIDVNKYICMACNHGTTITVVSHNNSGAYLNSKTPETTIQSEVLITQEKDLTLMLLTADCLPASFYDPNTGTIALAHFSRKSIDKMLPQKTVIFLSKNLSINPKNILVYIGPHINKSSYKFPLPLEKKSATLAPFIEEKNSYAHIDIVSATNFQLKNNGIKKENILVSKIDTAISSRYFSYYKSKKNNSTNGRMATILTLLN